MRGESWEGKGRGKTAGTSRARLYAESRVMADIKLHLVDFQKANIK